MGNPLRARPSQAVPRAASPGLAPPPASYAPLFEYTGPTALQLIGPVTRHAYFFERPGARLAIDPRDTLRIASVPHLRPVAPR